jgi:hypothetical protein
MTNHDDQRRHALQRSYSLASSLELSDDELEALVSGGQAAGPAGQLISPVPPGSPVESVLAELRMLRNLPAPPPGVELGAFFASSAPPFQPATGYEVQGDAATVALAADASHAGPLLVGLDHGGPGQQQGAGQPPVAVARSEVYRSSPLEALAHLLRPSGTKILMGATVAIVAVATSHAFGLVDLPFVAGSAVGDEAVAAGEPNNPAAAPADDPSIAGPAAEPSRFGAADAATTTTAAPTTAAPATVTVPEEPAAATTTTTTIESSTDETSETAETAPTVPATVGESTTSPDEASSTQPSTTATLLPNDFLLPGQSYQVPADLPAGTYGGTVRARDGCSVTVTRAGGAVESVSAEAAEQVQVELADGDGAEVGEGCPRLKP